jgi:hypothetical protein
MRLHSIDNRMINECGAIGGTITGWGNEVFGENLPQYHFVHR